MSKFQPWLTFGMNDEEDFICLITTLPSKPESGGLLVAMIAEHIIECYAAQHHRNIDEVSAEVWSAIIRTSLSPSDRSAYIHMPVQGDES